MLIYKAFYLHKNIVRLSNKMMVATPCTFAYKDKKKRKKLKNKKSFSFSLYVALFIVDVDIVDYTRRTAMPSLFKKPFRNLAVNAFLKFYEHF